MPTVDCPRVVVAGGVYWVVGWDWLRGVQVDPHNAFPSAPIASRQSASLHEYSSERCEVGGGSAGIICVVGTYTSDVSMTSDTVVVGDTAVVVVTDVVVRELVVGAAELVVDTTETESVFSSGSTPVPTITTPRTPTASTPAPKNHRHVRLFVAGAVGSPTNAEVMVLRRVSDVQ